MAPGPGQLPGSSRWRTPSSRLGKGRIRVSLTQTRPDMERRTARRQRNVAEQQQPCGWAGAGRALTCPDRVVTRGRGGHATHQKPPSPPRGRECQRKERLLWCGAVRAEASLFDVPRKLRVPTDQRHECPFLWEIWVDPKSQDDKGTGQGRGSHSVCDR